MLKHLAERKCNPDFYPGFGYDEDVVSFPLYNFGRKRTGFIAYRPAGAKRVRNSEKGRYYTYITKGEVGVFGLESIDFSPYILLVSGLFKATALHRLGQCALHVSSVSPRMLVQQLRLYNRPYFAIGDNDSEGATFARKLGGIQSPVDVDEMTDTAIMEMVRELVVFNR